MPDIIFNPDLLNAFKTLSIEVCKLLATSVRVGFRIPVRRTKKLQHLGSVIVVKTEYERDYAGFLSYHSARIESLPEAHQCHAELERDDSVSLGNAWDDYTGFGSYAIEGEAGSIDRYPSTVPGVIGPALILMVLAAGILAIPLLYFLRKRVRLRHMHPSSDAKSGPLICRVPIWLSVFSFHDE